MSKGRTATRGWLVAGAAGVLGRSERGQVGEGAGPAVEGCPDGRHSHSSAVPASVSVVNPPPPLSHRRHRLVSLARPHTRPPESLLAATPRPPHVLERAWVLLYADWHNTWAFAYTSLTSTS
ncbi:hypothetical protein E2C01_043614 [Portunus trituberculatus]|uniref:Uncharacterized protein n=1 Tax=Portunus trituberculatus TaxID=210409 RepID=A0A5B7FPY0_PORTR|nr:hypothetical protein [Portunus trituberculatus]